MKKFLLFIILAFFAMACSQNTEDNKPNDGTTTKYSIKGYVQKGPFIQGSSITISALDNNLEPTGSNYQIQTSDDFGVFSLGKQISSKYVEVIANGYYFDEVKGILSASQLSLRAIADLSATININVNLLTTLETKRIKYLITQNSKTFSEAKTQAEKEILEIFSIKDIANLSSFDQMDISKVGESNAILLAVSSILQGQNDVASLSELISKIATDIEQDGILDNQTYVTSIKNNGIGLNLSSIKTNLLKRYSDLGITNLTISNFEDYVDSDGDGLINKNDFTSVFTPVTNADLNTSYTSEETTVVLPVNITTATATVSEGAIVKNGTDTGLKTTSVVNGDKLSIKLTSSQTLATKVESTLIITYLGYNVNNLTGKYEITTRTTNYFSINLTPVASADLNTSYTSAETTVVLPASIPTATATITEGTIVKNGSDTGLKTTSVVNGDKVAVKLTSGNYYGVIVESTLSVTYLTSTVTGKYRITGKYLKWVLKTTDSNELTVRSGHSSLVFNNKIWVIGGAYIDSKNDVWYSADGINWTKATNNAGWEARNNHTSIVFDNKMWVIGGSDGGTPKNDVWYSADGINWTKATNNPGWTARYGHTSVVFDNKMWVIGGCSLGPLNDVWYSSDGITWTKASDSLGWGARCYHSSVVFDNKIWIIGGLSGDGVKNDVWYSSNGMSWTKATDNIGGVRSNNNYSTIVFDNKIWTMGEGISAQDIYLSRQYIPVPNNMWYSTDGISWAKATDNIGWYDRRYGYSSVVFNNKMLFLCGSSTGHIYNDIWSSE